MTVQVEGYHCYDAPVNVIEKTPALIFGDIEYDYETGATRSSYETLHTVHVVIQATNAKKGAEQLRELLKRSNLPKQLETAMGGKCTRALSTFLPELQAAGNYVAGELTIRVTEHN